MTNTIDAKFKEAVAAYRRAESERDDSYLSDDDPRYAAALEECSVCAKLCAELASDNAFAASDWRSIAKRHAKRATETRAVIALGI